MQVYVDLGKFSWSLPTPYEKDEDKFNMHLALLKAYSETHKDCNVPQSYVHITATEKKIYLGQWLSTQRHLHRKGSLSYEREVKLQELVNQGKLFWNSTQRVSQDQALADTLELVFKDPLNGEDENDVPTSNNTAALQQTRTSYPVGSNVMSYYQFMTSQSERSDLCNNQISDVVFEELERQQRLQQLQYQQLLMQYQHGQHISHGTLQFTQPALELPNLIQQQTQQHNNTDVLDQSVYRVPETHSFVWHQSQQHIHQQQQQFLSLNTSNELESSLTKAADNGLSHTNAGRPRLDSFGGHSPSKRFKGSVGESRDTEFSISNDE